MTRSLPGSGMRASLTLRTTRQLGASIVVEHDDHLVLADPEGNEFCLSKGP